MVLLLFLSFTLSADEILVKLFSELEIVKKEDKFKVVNAIKEHIVALKQQERVNAIKLLKAKKKAELKMTKEIVNVENIKADKSSREGAMKVNKEDMKEHRVAMKNRDMFHSMPKKMSHIESMQNMPIVKEMQQRRENGGQLPNERNRRGMMGNR